MATGFYPVIDGKTRKAKANYAVVGGVTKKIAKMYAVVDGKTRLIWSGGSVNYVYTGIYAEQCTDSYSPEYSPTIYYYNYYLGTREDNKINMSASPIDLFNYSAATVSKDGSTMLMVHTDTTQDKHEIRKFSGTSYEKAYNINFEDVTGSYTSNAFPKLAKFNSDGTQLYVPAIDRLVKGDDYKVYIHVIDIGDTSATYNKSILLDIADTISGSASRSINDLELSDDLKYAAISITYKNSSAFQYKSYLFGAATPLTFSTRIHTQNKGNSEKNDVENVFLDPNGKYFNPYGYADNDNYDGTITSGTGYLYYISGTSVTRFSSSVGNASIGKHHLYNPKTNMYISKAGGNTVIYKVEGTTVTNLGSYTFYKNVPIDITEGNEVMLYARARQSSYGIYSGYTYQQLTTTDTGLINGYSYAAQICDYGNYGRGNAFFINRESQ